jgi:hypothetical protein
MSETVTIESLASQLRALRERVEDLEDIRDYEAAVKENNGEPLIPWEEAKRDLDISTVKVDIPTPGTGC